MLECVVAWESSPAGSARGAGIEAGPAPGASSEMAQDFRCDFRPGEYGGEGITEICCSKRVPFPGYIPYLGRAPADMAFLIGCHLARAISARKQSNPAYLLTPSVIRGEAQRGQAGEGGVGRGFGDRGKPPASTTVRAGRGGGAKLVPFWVEPQTTCPDPRNNRPQ